MSELERLIQELCPNGVEYKKLKEVTEMKRGTSVTKKDVTEGDIPVISGGREPAYYCDQYNREGETITVAGSGAGAGYVQYWTTPIFVCDAFSLKGLDFVQTKYLYYCLSNMQEDIYSTKKGGGVPHVHISSIENFKVPVPPIEVQGEIVRILDNFTELTAELTTQLTAELTNRKKQYECYRELVLDKNEKVEWVPLLDVADTFTGLTYKPSDVAPTGTIVLRSSNIQNRKLVFDDNVYVQMDNIPQRAIVQEDDVLICVRNGSKALIGKAAMIPKHNTPMAFGAFMTILRAKKQINPKYLFFVWQSPRIQNMIHGESGMPINQITKKMLEQILVPLPSLEEQLKVVEVLERFDDIYVEIADKLNAEIEARQKQYEYYRGKLLTFKEASE